MNAKEWWLTDAEGGYFYSNLPNSKGGFGFITGVECRGELL